MEFLSYIWREFGTDLTTHWKALVTASVIAPVFLWFRKVVSDAISWVVGRMKAFIKQFMAMPSSIATISTNLNTLTTKVDKLEKQVGSNNGSTLHDNVLRIKSGIASLVQKERALVNASNVMMWQSNENGQCEWASNELQTLVGYTFDEGFAGSNWTSLYFTEDKPEIEKRWEQFIATGSSMTHRSRYRHVTGAPIPVLIDVKKLPDGGIIGMVRDLRRHQDPQFS